MTHAQDAALSAAERRLAEAGAEIADLLAADLLTYPDRELERRFLARPEAAAHISDLALQQLRARSKALGHTLAVAASERLGVAEPWLALCDSDALPIDCKDLTQLPSVFGLLGTVSGSRGLCDLAVEGLAEEHGLGGDDRTPPGYQPPKRFIDRKYLPTLVEAVVRHVATVQALRQKLGETAAQQAQHSLAERWGKAGG